MFEKIEKCTNKNNKLFLGNNLIKENKRKVKNK